MDPDAFWQWNVMGLLQNSPFFGFGSEWFLPSSFLNCKRNRT